MSMLLLAAVQAAEEGLTAEEVVASLPFDAFSIFALVLLAGAFAAVVYFGTRSWAAPDEKPVNPTVTGASAPAARAADQGGKGGGRQAA